ncbi:MAG: hypothetical protein MZV63_24125 [Marinilabiliales bacterium]|nr:hypothetical protein [Marinilabiliales bacterium]
MFRAYSFQGFQGIMSMTTGLCALRIANLRLEAAKMLGFRNYAEMVLGDRMADRSCKSS